MKGTKIYLPLCWEVYLLCRDVRAVYAFLRLTFLWAMIFDVGGARGVTHGFIHFFVRVFVCPHKQCCMPVCTVVKCHDCHIPGTDIKNSSLCCGVLYTVSCVGDNAKE